jgi:beta-phosphoglucomutase-like phosphatase (HAD superfamily)
MSRGGNPEQPLLVVSDLMGTMLRDDGVVLPAYRAAFAECEIPFTEEELAAKRGAHKLALFSEFAARRYPAAEVPKIAAAALDVFEARLRRFLASGGVTEIPGAGAALASLRKAGVKTALTSGFDRGLITDIGPRRESERHAPRRAQRIAGAARLPARRRHAGGHPHRLPGANFAAAHWA